MTTIVVTFECPGCGAGLALDQGRGTVTLRDGAGGPVDPPEAGAADATATPPAPTARRAPRRPLTEQQLRHGVIAALAVAREPLTRNAIADAIGVTKGSRAYATGIPRELSKLMSARLVEQHGTNRGHPAYRLTAEGRFTRPAQEGIERWAAAVVEASTAATVDDDASPTSPTAAAPDDGSASTSDTSPGSPRRLPSTPPTARTTPDGPLEQRTTRARVDADTRRAQLTERLMALLDEHGELTVREMAEHLGVKVASLTSLRVDLEKRGRISWRRAKPGTEQPLYYRVPLASEVEGVEIIQNDPADNGSIQGRVLQALLLGGKTVPDLAAELDLHPALVAQAVSLLIREGEVEKQPGGKYMRLAL